MVTLDSRYMSGTRLRGNFKAYVEQLLVGPDAVVGADEDAAGRRHGGAYRLSRQPWASGQPVGSMAVPSARCREGNDRPIGARRVPSGALRALRAWQPTLES